MALVDTDKIGATTQLDSEVVMDDIKKISKILTATTQVYQYAYLYQLVYPLVNFSVNDRNKEVSNTGFKAG